MTCILSFYHSSAFYLIIPLLLLSLSLSRRYHSDMTSGWSVNSSIPIQRTSAGAYKTFTIVYFVFEKKWPLCALYPPNNAVTFYDILCPLPSLLTLLSSFLSTILSLFLSLSLSPLPPSSPSPFPSSFPCPTPTLLFFFDYIYIS